MFKFDLNKYLGLWYELVHYPSWFQRNDNYNTTAEYKLNDNNTISVQNSTITQGKHFESYGIAVSLGDTNFHVNFDMSEVNKLIDSNEFKQPLFSPNQNLKETNLERTKETDKEGDKEGDKEANYVINRIWANDKGEYIFAIVTDAKYQSLYVLSRYKHPSLLYYNGIMEYVLTNFDRDRLVQTPHFD